MRDFLQRFFNIPDMLELDHLTVSGDVTFGKDVVLKVRSSCLVKLSFLLANVCVCFFSFHYVGYCYYNSKSW